MESVRKRVKLLADQGLGDSRDVKTYSRNKYENPTANVYEIDQSLMRHIIPEAFLGYIWWSMFFSLAHAIWLSPLDTLDLSGYVGIGVALFSPSLTLIPVINRLTRSSTGIITSQVLPVVGVLSYHMPTAQSRLLGICFGTFFAMLWLTEAWWCKSREYREYAFWGLTTGFFVKLVLHISFLTLNPIWTSTTTNLIVFAIGMLCAFYRANFIKSIGYEIAESHARQPLKEPALSQWVIVAFGTGAWLFFVQWLFGEVSIVSRYTGDEFPSMSLMPVPGGILVLVALAIGISVSPRRFITSSGWWLFGGLSAVLFYKTSSLPAFFGGLGLAVYIMSIFPRIANQISKCSKGKSLTLAFLVYVVFLLASVCVVAFNYVSGCAYTRERSDLILAIAMIFIGFAVAIDLESEDGEGNETLDLTTKRKGDTLSGNASRRKNSVLRDGVLPALHFLLLIGSIFMAGRYYQRETNRRESKLAVKDNKLFTTMVWAVNFGSNNQGWHNFHQSRQMMSDIGADVIGILESDCSRPFLGSTDFVTHIEEELGFYSDYGPRTKDHTGGAAIISRYPIIESKHYLLPSLEGKLAPALLASINMTDQIIDFVVAHIGNNRDDLDRKLQAEELAKIMDSSKNPIVFLGYVNSAPGSRDYLQLLEAGRAKDIDYEDYQRLYEYIFYRDLMRVGYARISHGGLSKTEVQAAKFRIPKNIRDFNDNNAVTTTASDVDESIRFSEKFGDFHIGRFQGEGHHFQMSTPKYYVSGQN